MSRIEPIPWDELSDDARTRIEAGLASRMYSVAAPLQIVAHSPVALQGMDEGYKACFGRSALGQRLQELLRLRSAQLNTCEPCSMSRKDDSLTEDDVACLIQPDETRYTRREVLALRFLDRFALDHPAIDDDMFRELAEEFTVEEIVELGWMCGQFVGGHRFMHLLDIFGTGAPVIRRDHTPSASRAEAAAP